MKVIKVFSVIIILFTLSSFITRDDVTATINIEYQHKGIGKQAFAILKDYCQEKGINRFACDCSPHNENAMQFYQRMGGVVTKTDTGHENKQEDGVIFEFNL